MTAENTTDLPESDSGHIDLSEGSSASPVYSGSSDMQDGISSVETTPPPTTDDYAASDAKRYSASSNGFSRSYRSAASSSYVDSVLSPGLFPQRLSGVDFRPLTSGTDDGTLAAATAGLNVAGTPKIKSSISDDIPPVPPVPQQYMHNPFLIHAPSLSHQISDERNYRGDQDHRTDFSTNNIAMEEEPMFVMDRDSHFSQIKNTGY